MDRFRKMFPSGKPLIAMAHLPPLPGTPLYDSEAGMESVVDAVRVDLTILLETGFNAVMFCNEGDRPYSLNAGYDGVAALTRVVSELGPRDRPFGVDFLWDPKAALAAAAATGASFIREVTTGVYESDMGLWNTDAASLLRYRRQLNADEVAIFMNVTPEFASQIGHRSVSQVARSAIVSSLADAVLVSGPMAGGGPHLQRPREAKDAVGGDVPVLVNTGAKSTNVEEFLRAADGVIVGSDLKVDGYTWNPVDAQRVRQFMEAVEREKART